MSAKRIDDFIGDDRTYAGYLLEVIAGFSLPVCISQLEEQVTRIRRDENRASESLSPRFDTGYPTPPATHNQTVFETWDPAIEYKKYLLADGSPAESTGSEHAESVGSRSTKWQKRTGTFFAGLPVSEEQWCKKREATGLLGASGILYAVDCLTTSQLSDVKSVESVEDHARKPDLQDALESFARIAGSSLVAGKLHHNISHFISLVFIATCCVAIYKGHEESLVDAAQREFLTLSRGKCEAGHKQLATDRTAVRWLLQEMQRQFRRGLRHRAFEIFLNGKKSTPVMRAGTNIVAEGKSLHFYTECPKDPKQNDLFSAKIPICKIPSEAHASLPFWIPFFVKFNAGDRWR